MQSQPALSRRRVDIGCLWELLMQGESILVPTEKKKKKARDYHQGSEVQDIPVIDIEDPPLVLMRIAIETETGRSHWS